MIFGSEILYREMLGKLSLARGRWRSIPLCGFVGLKGKKYDGNLLVVGRAVNGWAQGWTAEQLREEKSLDKVVSEMFVENRQLTWVTDTTENYNTRKSAFWRVIRKIVGGLSVANVENDSWPSYIAWSNLYKVSPAEGRNPSNALAEAQFSYCAKILDAEIKMLTPRRILFLTGLNWAQPFLKELDFRPDLSVEGPIAASGRISSGSQIVVLPHPERKREDPIVTAAVNYFSNT